MSVRLTPVNCPIIIRSDDKINKRPKMNVYIWLLKTIINYQWITRQIEVTYTYVSAKFCDDDLRSRFARPSSPRCQAFTKTRYSRSVLINRLFMFNAAWYSDPRKFSKLSDEERDCDRNQWVGRRENFEQGNAFASRRRLWNQSKKTSRETAESSSCIGPVFCSLSRRPISRTQDPGFTREHENIEIFDLRHFRSMNA